MIIYLAAPIDFDSGSEISKVKHDVKKHFSNREGVWVYDPAGAWCAPADLKPDEYVHWANLKVLADADYMVAVLQRGVLTVGTILEIQHAHDLGIPTVVIGDVGDKSVGLAALGVPVYESIKEWSEYGGPAI